MKEEKDNRLDVGDRISQSLKKVLDRHGYSFQYSILRRMEELRSKGETLWQLEGAELPVNFKSEVTHVDFICRFIPRYRENLRFFFVAECKRVDRSKGNWCFVKSPYTWSRNYQEFIQFDEITRFSEIPQFTSATKIVYTNKGTMDLGLEIKSNEQGDGVGSNEKSQINKAVSQVLRGSSGFINYLSDDWKKRKELTVDKNYLFIPVIFTTAKIYVTQADLGSADLESGFLSEDSVTVEEKDWIWFNHNRSNYLSHDVRFDYDTNQNENTYFREFTRSVAIVGPKGVDSFLKTNFEDLIY